MVNSYLMFKRSFHNFFLKKKHLQVWGTSAVPFKKLNLLLTNAGMNQFINFLSEVRTPLTCFINITDSQLCVRLGGGFNDLNSVGLDHTHRTSFAMLGNWSLGSYFKENSLKKPFELFCIWKMPIHRVHVTIFDPLYEKFNKPPFTLLDYETLLHTTENLGKLRLNVRGRLHSKSKRDNFWQVGSTGPCGHSSEFFFNHSKEKGCLVDSMLELWNVVFVKFFKSRFFFSTLKKNYVDTGLGLERLLGLYNTTLGYKTYKLKYSVYRSKTFIKFVNNISLIRVAVSDVNCNYPYRLIYDHMSTIFNLLKSNVTLGNKGEGFVLKKLISRVVYFTKVLGLDYNLGRDLLIKTFISCTKSTRWRVYVAQLNFFYYKQYVCLSNSNFIIKKAFRDEFRDIPKGVFKMHSTYGFSLKNIKKLINRCSLRINWRVFLKISV